MPKTRKSRFTNKKPGIEVRNKPILTGLNSPAQANSPSIEGLRLVSFTGASAGLCPTQRCNTTDNIMNDGPNRSILNKCAEYA